MLPHDQTPEPPQGDMSWRVLPPLAQLYVTAVMGSGAAGPAGAVPQRFSAALAVRRAGAGRMSDRVLESQPAHPARKRLHAVGVVRGEAGDPAPARTGALGARRRRGSHYAVHLQGPATLSALSHGLQRGGGSADDGRDRAGIQVAGWRRSGISRSSRWRSPLVGAIVTYFLVNTGLVAGAIALSTSRSFGDVWRHDFLWSGVTYMVAGTAGAVAAIVVQRGDHWIAILLLAPVYLTYRTYLLFLARFEDQQRHMADMRRMHGETVQALSQAHQAERALANEKERLAVALADMTPPRRGAKPSARAGAGGTGERRRRQSAEGSVPRRRLARTANTAQRDPRLGRHAAHRQARWRQRERAHQTIYDSARQQAQLIDDLLDVARIMSGKLRLRAAVVDIDEVVRGAMQILQPAADARRVYTRLTVEPSLDDGLRRSRPRPADRVEPAVQRDQVFRGRRRRSTSSCALASGAVELIVS